MTSNDGHLRSNENFCIARLHVRSTRPANPAAHGCLHSPTTSITATTGIQHLVNLQVSINTSNKDQGRGISNGSCHNSKSKTEKGHVAEVQRRHQKPCHFGLVEEEVNSVQKHVHRCGCTQTECRPWPPVIFSAKQEIDADNRHTHRNYHEDSQHQQHEAVHIIELVVPKACEHEIQLNEDGPKRQNSPTHHEHPAFQIPLFLRDQTRDLTHTGDVFVVLPGMSANHRPEDYEGEGHKAPYQQHDNHGPKRDGLRRPIAPSDEIHQEYAAHARARE
mmetsp:Transcript_86890/g.144649  ORF Transcript_86890/g.144649 Transcript_86890/m.144649 type:complete len:276 (+) Transcript_86890:495-1322(+)